MILRARREQYIVTGFPMTNTLFAIVSLRLGCMYLLVRLYQDETYTYRDSLNDCYCLVMTLSQQRNLLDRLWLVGEVLLIGTQAFTLQLCR